MYVLGSVLCWRIQNRKMGNRTLPLLGITLLFLVSSCRTTRYPLEQDLLPPAAPVNWEETDFPGLQQFSYANEEETLKLSALAADLGSGQFHFVLTPPDPEGEGETRSDTVSGFAEKFGLAAAINAAPFDRDGLFYRQGIPCDISGIYIYDGQWISRSASRFDALYIFQDETIRIGGQTQIPSGARWAVGGLHIALKDGEIQGSRDARHPRSVVGLSRDGKTFYLAVFDGRQKEAAGVTTEEIGWWMAWLGAWDALNMDGGGGSCLVLEQDGEIQILNTPIHQGLPGRERSVASHIGLAYIPTP